MANLVITLEARIHRVVDRTAQRAPARPNFAMLVAAGAVALAVLLAARRQAGPGWQQYTGSAQVRVITPALTDEPELCLTCHYGIEEISAAHPVETFGCVVCHGGDRLSLDAEAAHAGMIGGRNPSNLAVAEEGCGGANCHSGSSDDQRDHIARVQRSVQATYAGAINSILFSFNQVEVGGPLYGVNAISDDVLSHPDTAAALLPFDPLQFENALVQRFGETCQTCHLTVEPIQQPYFYRSTGCASCHAIYNTDGLYRGSDPTIPRDEPGHMAQHRLTVQIPYSQCNTCHNRGNYSLVGMEFAPRTDLDHTRLPGDPNERRLAEYYQPIGLYTQCEWELDCIDCHTSREVMGDGDIHPNQASAQTVQCKTCHGTLTELPTFVTITDPNDPAIRRASLHSFSDVHVGDEVLLTPAGDTIGSVQWIDGKVIQLTKVTGITYEVPLVIDSQCEQKPEEQESRYCHACHAINTPGSQP